MNRMSRVGCLRKAEWRARLEKDYFIFFCCSVVGFQHHLIQKSCALLLEAIQKKSIRMMMRELLILIISMIASSMASFQISGSVTMLGGGFPMTVTLADDSSCLGQLVSFTSVTASASAQFSCALVSTEDPFAGVGAHWYYPTHLLPWSLV